MNQIKSVVTKSIRANISKKKINKIPFLKKSCKQAQRDFCKSMIGSSPERPERGGPAPRGVDSKSTKRNLRWLVRWALHVGKREFNPALTALVSPVQFFSSPYAFFNLCLPITQQPGQAVVRGRLSLNVCLRSCLSFCFCFSEGRQYFRSFITLINPMS